MVLLRRRAAISPITPKLDHRTREVGSGTALMIEASMLPYSAIGQCFLQLAEPSVGYLCVGGEVEPVEVRPFVTSFSYVLWTRPVPVFAGSTVLQHENE